MKISPHGVWTARVFAVVLALCSIASAARGDQPHVTGNGWTFRATPYVWVAGMSGTVSTFPPLPNANVDASFDDIIGNADFALMLNGEARRDRLGIIFDTMFVDLTVKGSTPGSLFSSVKAENTVFMGAAMGAYRVYDAAPVTFDIVGGARLWSVENALTLRAGLLAERSGSVSETWVDPLLGVRVRSELGDGFYLRAYGDVGGIAIGSDVSWQLLGAGGYTVNDWFSVEAGYRHLAVDYNDNGFVYDVSFTGPIVGLNFRF